MYDLNAELFYPFLFRLKIIERNAKGKMRKGSQLRVDLRRFISREPIYPFLFEKRQVVIPCPDGIEDNLAAALLDFSQNLKADHLFVKSSHQIKVVDTQRYFSNSCNRLVWLVHGYSVEGNWLQQRSSFLGRMLWMSIGSFTTDISELCRILLLNQPPNGWASAARHHHKRQPSKMMLNFGSWAGRLQSALAHTPFPHRRNWQAALAPHLV
jgi:hypothetical protein